jgi:hypothetical protein
MALVGSGCAGFVGGDLRNTSPDSKVAGCGEARRDYRITYKSDARDDYGDKNLSGFITSLTLGIIPTYWTRTVRSEATVFHDGAPVFTRTYTSRIHQFYGILWPLILPSKSINALGADEGGGLRIEWGIRDRTLSRVVADHGGTEDRYCLQNESSP